MRKKAISKKEITNYRDEEEKDGKENHELWIRENNKVTSKGKVVKRHKEENDIKS